MQPHYQNIFITPKTSINYMRILIRVKALNDCARDIKYHHKLQGFIYNLLRDTPYSVLHDKKGYKFISFSNIFPSKDMKTGNIRHLIVSSPDNVLIKFFKERLEKIENGHIGIGEMLFKIEQISLLEPNLGRGCAT